MLNGTFVGHFKVMTKQGDTLVVTTRTTKSRVGAPPPATVDVTLGELADPDVPLPIAVRAGFRDGADPLDSRDVAPPILQESPAVAEVTPTLASLSKTSQGPEDETANGPDVSRPWTIELTFAEGQELTGVKLANLLPESVRSRQVRPTVPSGLTEEDITVVALDPEESALVADGRVEGTFAVVTATGGVSAVSETDFSVADLDAGDAPVLDSSTGQPVTSENEGRMTGSWEPMDDRDDELTDVERAAPATHVLTDRALASLGFDDAPPIEITESGCDAGAPGSMLLGIDRSAAPGRQRPDAHGRLAGVLVDAPNRGPAQGTSTSRGAIDANRRRLDDGDAGDSLDPIDKTVTISGAVVRTDRTLSRGRVTNGPSAGVVAVEPSLSKIISNRAVDVATRRIPMEIRQ